MTSSNFEAGDGLEAKEELDLGKRGGSLDPRILDSDDSGFWESQRPGLEHCNSALVRSNSASFLRKSHDVFFSRSKTIKKESPKFDLKLDKLSESEKKKVIENLVKVQKDGTVEVDVACNAPVASDLLKLDTIDTTSYDNGETVFDMSKPVPKLKIAVLVVGTRGDVQPFIAVAKRLQEFGHRVRLATHVNFGNFVLSHGVEFYPLGGDPRIMARYFGDEQLEEDMLAPETDVVDLADA